MNNNSKKNLFKFVFDQFSYTITATASPLHTSFSFPALIGLQFIG